MPELLCCVAPGCMEIHNVEATSTDFLTVLGLTQGSVSPVTDLEAGLMCPPAAPWEGYLVSENPEGCSKVLCLGCLVASSPTSEAVSFVPFPVFGACVLLCGTTQLLPACLGSVPCPLLFRGRRCL